MNDMTKGWPDWQDEKAYPSYEEISRTQWAWEFLRRNPEYQKMWDELIGAVNKSDKENTHDNKVIRQKFETRFGLTIIGNNPIPSPSWSYEKGVLNFSLQTFEIKRIKTGNKKPQKAGVNKENNPRILTITRNNDKTATITFDLTMPITPQINNAKWALDKILDDEGITPHQNDIENFKTYIRLLDAEATNTRTKDISAIFYPNIENEYPDYKANRKIRDQLKKAKAIRDAEYLFIPNI